MVRVGLTGNYGMGKSAALNLFRELGAFTINADEIVAGLLTEQPVLDTVRGIFGDGVFDEDGRLLKDRAASIVFSDGEKKKALEALIHPLVFQRVDELIEETRRKIQDVAGADADAGVVVIEAPLLFEGGHEKRFDKTVTVYSEETLAIDRLEREGVARKDAALRIRSQMPIQEKIRRSDFIIENNGTPEELKRRIRQVYEALKGL